MARPDPHSYRDDTQAQVTRVELDLKVSFERKVLEGRVLLTLDRSLGGPLDLDTRDLTILSVHDAAGQPIAHELSSAEPVLGSRLRLQLPAGCAQVRIAYETSPQASALQWLEPPQTHGKAHPYLFTQCQAIHARSVLPIQDTPEVRIRYRAAVDVPAPLRAVAAAAAVGREVRGERAIETFEMPQPIPPYLLAFAVGDLVSTDVGPRSRVWAEPGVVGKAAWEFAKVESMICAAEELFGPYPWERFDILVMPPSFPYGGMENPRLTFLTPTLIAGDRSLVNVLVHELAHSWTGNLVTNASAEHFWLNEGFTVYAERRILEHLEGPEVARLHAALGLQVLRQTIDDLEQHPEWTCLRTHLAGVDPDEAYSSVPYEKGCLLLNALERACGREAFDRFLLSYIDEHRFRSLTTDQFLDFARQHLPAEALSAVGLEGWIFEPGLPPGLEDESEQPLQQPDGKLATEPDPETSKGWSAAEWQLYLQRLPRPGSKGLCEVLDRKHGFTQATNYEILVSWLELALRCGYEPAYARTWQVLGEVGRMKYLKPLYSALLDQATTRASVLPGYLERRGTYHPIAQGVLDGILGHRASC